MTIEYNHQELTDIVYERCKQNPRYEWVEKNLPYSECGIDGEFDVVAKVKNKDSYVYFECKTHHCPRADNKALWQFERVKYYAYPTVDWRFVEVANRYAKRVRV